MQYKYSQEHLKTMVYAKFGGGGGQTECFMGDSKITEFTMYMQGKEKNPVLNFSYQ